MSLEITKFFYVAIPGSVFLSFWIHIYGIDKIQDIIKLNLKEHYSLVLLLFIIFALFVGFLLQAIWKKTRKCFKIDEIVICIYNCKKKQEDKLDLDEIKNYHAKLWAKNQHHLSDYFSSFAACWGHIFIGSILTIIFYIFLGYSNNLLILILVLLAFFSFVFHCMYRSAMFDTINRQKEMFDPNSRKKLTIIRKDC